MVNHYPNNAPFGCRVEKISGTAFVAPRQYNLQTYLYRAESSFFHNEFEPYNHHLDFANPSTPKHLNPNSHQWPNFVVGGSGDWTEQRLVGSNGAPNQKSGLAMWVFNVKKNMEAQTAFASLDGEALIVPQSGSLDITTELGKMLVRANEIAVIPRGMRYHVDLVDGKPCRGYVCELYQGHFRLPELGIIGSTGLANARDFEIPKAFYDGTLVPDETFAKGVIAVGSAGPGGWKILSRLDRKMWICEQPTTPFSVIAWSGTLYPYKYDMSKFNLLTNAAFDHHDPSLFVILTAPAFGKEPNTAVIDFAALTPRWEVSQDTPWIPWYHRNTMQEFVTPVISDPSLPINDSPDFAPFGAWLNGSMVTHGSNEEEFAQWRNKSMNVPEILMNDGVTICMFETELPLLLTDWALDGVVLNYKNQLEAAFGVAEK